MYSKYILYITYVDNGYTNTIEGDKGTFPQDKAQQEIGQYFI